MEATDFYQFTALPCNIATVPLQFTMVAKEVKLMALAEGIQYSPVYRQLANEIKIKTAMPREYPQVGSSCRNGVWKHC